MLLKYCVDLDQVALDKFSGRQVAGDCAPHPIRVRPGPVRTLVGTSECKRDLVHHIVGASAVSKWQHRDRLRRDSFVIGSNLGLHLARIEFDHTIEPGFPAVTVQSIFMSKERTTLVVS